VSAQRPPDPSRSPRERADRQNVLMSELRWAGFAVFVLAAMLGTIVVTSLAHALHPPSNVEAVDSDHLHLKGEFVESNLGTETLTDGSVIARVVASKFAFVPRCVPVPAGEPVRLRYASPDVVHGVIVDGTNVNTMVVPGYIAEVKTRFDVPGDHYMPCHEYCGQGHSQMWGVIRVVPREEWAGDPAKREACVADRPPANL
jgi:cytochrome c oxidase subunit II